MEEIARTFEDVVEAEILFGTPLRITTGSMVPCSPQTVVAVAMRTLPAGNPRTIGFIHDTGDRAVFAAIDLPSSMVLEPGESPAHTRAFRSMILDLVDAKLAA
jgi:hypothetical protein